MLRSTRAPRALGLALASFLLIVAAAPLAAADKVLVNRNKDGVALQGYDPVAYFTDSKPVPGKAAISASHEGATYYFASDEHRRLFVADPGKYAPQFGGYCGYAASINKLSPISPEFFQILDGRLVLQHNQKAWDLWNKDLEANLAKANHNWPGLVAHNGSASKQLLNLDANGVILQGYDPVAFFKDGKPALGAPEISAVFGGAIYHFVSKENKDTFEFDPVRYAPQFGGYCAYAAAFGQLAPIDPNAFVIVNGRLLLQHNAEALALFAKDPQGLLAKADQHWPKLVDKNGK